MSPVSVCPNALDLERLLQGGLTQADADNLEQHVQGCRGCQQVLETVDTADGLLQTVRAVAVKPASRPSAAVDRLIAQLALLSTRFSETVFRDGGASVAVLRPAQAPGEIGRLGPYRVLGVLGQGGMGIVFRAEDMQLQRLVALKVIHPRLAASVTARARFQREARSAAALEHDHILPIYQVGEEAGVPYLAFPLLRGENLEQRLQREPTLALPELLRIGREIAQGLHAAHVRGLIHRDIKPANIFLVSGGVVSGGVVSGGEPVLSTEYKVPPSHHSPLTTHHSTTHHSPARVKILDFGLARAVAEAGERGERGESSEPPASASLTHAGMVLGTPAYMAPEQARGDAVDGRADLYSLGAVLYRMTTGQVPFPGNDTTAVLAALAKEPPPSPRLLNPKVPARLAQLILALLAKEPADRPGSAAEVAERLAALQQTGRPRWRKLVGTGLLAALIIGAAAYLLRPRADETPEDPSAAEVVAGVEFLPAAGYEVGLNPYFITVGDLNGDGKKDLVVVNMGPRGVKVEDMTPSTVSVLLGNGDGSFQPAQAYAVDRHPLSACLADVNGDGKMDIVVADMNLQTQGFASVLLGHGDGTFQPAGRFAAGGRHPSSIVAADFNGDGKLDLAVAFEFHVGGVSILVGNGDGTFGPPVFYPTGVHTGNLTLGDFNHDGRLDLAVANSSSGTVSVLLGQGDGTFQQPCNYRIERRHNLAGAADFFGAGKLDLLVRVNAVAGEPYLRLLRGQGDGTFREGPRLPGGEVAVVADFNGDRRADIVSLQQVRAEGKSNVHLHLGKGRGEFQSTPHALLDFLAFNAAAGDLDGDGRPDLVVSVDGSNKVWVLLNRPAAERLRVPDQQFEAGRPGTILITAEDAAGSTAAGYTGTVRITCAGAPQGLPQEYRFTPRDKGVRPFDPIVFATPGRYTVTVSDVARPALQATGSILVQPRPR